MNTSGMLTIAMASRIVFVECYTFKKWIPFNYCLHYFWFRSSETVLNTYIYYIIIYYISGNTVIIYEKNSYLCYQVVDTNLTDVSW